MTQNSPTDHAGDPVQLSNAERQFIEDLNRAEDGVTKAALTIAALIEKAAVQKKALAKLTGKNRGNR